MNTTAPVQISFQQESIRAAQGSTAVLNILLSETSPQPISVDIAVGEGAARPDQHFRLSQHRITFTPGTTEQQVTIDIPDDGAFSTERSVVLSFRNVQGANYGSIRRSRLTIPASGDPDLLIDFEESPPFTTSEGTTLTLVDAAADSILPEQTSSKQVLRITTGNDHGYISRQFPTGQDWCNRSGLTLRYFGSDSGNPVSIELLCNPQSQTGDPVLAWSDEFDDPAGTPPNPAFWNSETGDGFLNGVTGWGNQELQYYTPDNAVTDGNGNLVITARQIDPAASDLLGWYGAAQYTSSRLQTAGKAEFMYGTIAARMKLPKGQGIWPAFWALGTDIGAVGWPECGEIDIMENVGKAPKTLHGTIHGPGHFGGNGIGGTYHSQDDLGEEFHVYGVNWQPDKIEWFIDDTTYFSASTADLPPDKVWKFNHPFYILLNLAVGGHWPGSPDETTVFPQHLFIDYVRVYQTPVSYTRAAATFTDDFTGWREIHLPFSDFTVTDAVGTEFDLADVCGYGIYLAPDVTATIESIRFKSS